MNNRYNVYNANINDDIEIAKLISVFKECNENIVYLSLIVNKLKAFMPLTAENYDDLTAIDLVFIDGFISRFIKLQDVIEEKLFRLILINLKENDFNSTNAPFINVLNKLEKYRIIDSAEEWLNLRNIRNSFAQEYKADLLKRIDALNKCFNNLYNLYDIYVKIKKYAENKLSKLKNIDISAYKTPELD